MADHSKPTTASAYASFASELDARFDDLTLGLDPAYVTPTNLPTNAVRFSSAAAKWQKWSGSAWGDLASTYAIAISGNAGTVTNGVYTNGSYADPSWLTSLAGSKITGNISGNAGTATTLATARTINGVSFNGAANINVNTVSSVIFNNAGSGAASGATFNGGSAITVSYNTVGAPSTSGTNASGTWNISVTGSAATAASAASCTGLVTSTSTSNRMGALLIGLGEAYIYESAANAMTIRTGSSAAPKYTTISAAGDLTTPAAITAVGDITAFSDERLKTNWRLLSPTFLDDLAELKVGIYERTDTGETQVGVGAQSLQRFLPQAVREGTSGMLSVAYGNAALAACVMLAREVRELKKKVGV